MCCALAASTIGGLVSPSGAAAATPCAKAIVDDWYDDGRIDRVYALPCYEQAIAAVPAEIRDYTNAEEVISRAFQAASGQRLKARTPQGRGHGLTPPTKVPPVVVTSSADAIPIPLLVLAGLATTMLVAGGIGYVSRRRRSDGPDSTGNGDESGRSREQ